MASLAPPSDATAAPPGRVPAPPGRRQHGRRPARTRRVAAQLPDPRAPTAPGVVREPPPVTAPGPERAEHPRTLGWVGSTALALGGSNQSLFVIGALFLAQGTAAVPLLGVGLLLSWLAAPGWIELVLMWPKRVGGIAAVCAEAFRPYSPVLANLTGVCYWWGWIPTCGLTATLSTQALHDWAHVPGPPMLTAVGIVLAFTAINLAGVRWATRAALVIGAVTFTLALLGAVVPVAAGAVDWRQASSFALTTPFHGVFGAVTSAMAGLYLIGFAAPAFEAATCHVGEMRDPVRTVPRAVVASGALAGLFFVVLPVVWLGTIGAAGLSAPDLSAAALGPTYGPLVGGAGRGVATAFLVVAMLHGCLQPLAGASRTMSQLSEDGLVPRVLARRNRRDVPWVATALTAGAAIVFLVVGNPIWLIAAANLAYLIGIALPSVAVWLLRRHEPDRARPWRAPRFTIGAGLVSAGAWLVATVLGFEQFGLPTVLLGMGLCYSCSALYAWRTWSDRRASGARSAYRSLHLKLTGAMLLVLVFDSAGYLLAVQRVDAGRAAVVTLLSDVFVAVALLTISVGLVLPGAIGHAVTQVADAARALTTGTVADLTRAMQALGDGDLDAARAQVSVVPVDVRSHDEVRAMADAFNGMQDEVARAARSLDRAREQLRSTRDNLQDMADNDPLTGLANRRSLEAALTAACLSGQDCALVVLDLDGFKDINDSRGHAVGDEVLRRVATLLRETVRRRDVVGRLGGDEFAVVLRDATLQDATGVAAALVAAVRDDTVVVAHGRRVRLSASVGVAVSSPGVPAAQLLIDADVAMYDAKERGRDRVSVSSAQDPGQARLKTRASTQELLRDALEQDRFELVAQPILALAAKGVGRHELLIRLRAEDGRLLPPAGFLPEAERSGLIGEVDRWVVRRTLRLLHDAAAAGADAPVSVNLSGPSMTDNRILDLLEAGLRDLPRSVSRPVFEVTETAAILDLDGARAFAERLASSDCALALDDFGAGYGSFHYLKHLPFAHLKIDGDFVADLPRNRADQVVVRAIVAIAREMGMTTTAEFVGDAETVALLRGYGVDYAQGFHVGRPVALGDAFPWLLDRPRSVAAGQTSNL